MAKIRALTAQGWTCPISICFDFGPNVVSAFKVLSLFSGFFFIIIINLFRSIDN